MCASYMPGWNDWVSVKDGFLGMDFRWWGEFLKMVLGVGFWFRI